MNLSTSPSLSFPLSLPPSISHQGLNLRPCIQEADTLISVYPQTSFLLPILRQSFTKLLKLALTSFCTPTKP